MLRSYPKLSSFPEILPSELQAEILLALPPKEILRICSEIEEFEGVCLEETFWERVWLKMGFASTSKIPSSTDSGDSI
jgi:hypothetical protein